MPETTYTHKDLSRQLKVSETTIKSYRRKFPNCIPVSSRGKPIRFTSDALAVCRRIRNLFDKGMSVGEVRSRLAEEFSWIEEVPAGAEAALPEGGAGLQPGMPAAAGSYGASETLGADGVEDEVSGAIVLPPGFANAISGLAKSVVALTRQQAEILERISGLESSLQNFEVSAMQAGPQAGESRLQPETADAGCPEWLEDFAERLKGMEQTLIRTLEGVEASLNSFQFSDDQVDNLIPPYGYPAPPSQPAQTVSVDEGGRVLPWRGQAPKGVLLSPQARIQDKRVSEEYLRHISTLPLAVQVAGDYTGLAGRGPFCLNDLKAILAQTFSPPNHFVGRWETASGELWYMLEQPEEADSESISLHLKPVETRRNQPMLEVARLMVGGVNEHPSSLYTLVQQLLG